MSFSSMSSAFILDVKDFLSKGLACNECQLSKCVILLKT